MGTNETNQARRGSCLGMKEKSDLGRGEGGNPPMSQNIPRREQRGNEFTNKGHQSRLGSCMWVACRHKT